MRTTLKPAQILSISLLLFAVFFGAGNMIFRPSRPFFRRKHVDFHYRIYYYRRRFIFTSYRRCCLAGGSFNTLASRVHPKFAAYSLSLFIFQSAHYLLFHELDLYLMKLGLHHFSQTNGTLC